MPSLHHSHPAEDVIEIGYNHEEEKEEHTDVLGDLHELQTWLLAGDDLDEKEEDVTAVKSGDRDDVHEGKDNAEEGCHLPEDHPVPLGWEHAADSAKAAKTLGSFL